MKKKTAIIISIIAFVLLCGLFVIERMYPSGGKAMINTLING